MTTGAGGPGISPSPGPPASEGPERAALAFGKALGACDPAAASACFAPDGRLLTPDGTEIAGRLGVGEVLAQLTASSPRIRFEEPRMVRVGTVALATQRWSVRADGVAPEPFSQAFLGTLVVRREGRRWQIAIAAPWGVGAGSVARQGGGGSR